MRSCRSQRAAMAAVVGDQHERRAGFAVQLEHQLHHRLAGGEVEAAGRLVGQQHAPAARRRRAPARRAAARRRTAPSGSGAAARPGRRGAASRWPARARRCGPAARAAASRSPARSGCRAAGSSGTRSPPWPRAPPARASSSIANRSMPASRTVPVVGVSSPAMIDSSVLLPEPEAPTMATDSRAARVKSMSWRIVSVPVESCTCLVTCSTAMMGSDMNDGVVLRGLRGVAAPLAGAL